MSRFSGSAGDQYAIGTWLEYGKGARERVRDLKRMEAEERNARTPRERTRQFRRDRATVRAAINDARSTTTRTGGTT